MYSLNQSSVAGIVEKHFPDWRRVLNELQRYSASGMIDAGILVNLSETNMKDLVTFLRKQISSLFVSGLQTT